MTDRQTQGPIRRVIIAGGGTAGWMCAAALSKALAGSAVGITLIESDDIGTVGVGEATIPAIHGFNSYLGLNQAEFLRATQGTFKLGIEFINWSQIGDSYIHPFTTYGRNVNNLHFHQLWLKYAQMCAVRGETTRLDDYNLCCVAARLNRFEHPRAGQTARIASLNYAFHFDAGLYARYLRGYAEARGVQRVEGQIADVGLYANDGYIRDVTLTDGRVFDGDLFVDCTGFRGLLIEGALKTGYEDWSHFLPNNRALAVPSQSPGDPIPYTRSTADQAGWRWRIPLQHRVGNGYVYCADFISDEDAAKALLNGLDGQALADPRPIRFTTGRRKRFWNKNCVTIGLASGFMEPLESTSIHLIQTAIMKLLTYFPDKGFDVAEIDAYNDITIAEYERIRDFIILHYKATQREDTPYWRQCRDMKVPDTLRQKMELFLTRGRLLVSLDELFTPPSWLSVMVGQKMVPRHYDPLVDAIDSAELEGSIKSIRSDIDTAASELPQHGDYVRAFCGNGS